MGRKPEYLGKKIGPTENKMIMLYALAAPLVILPLTAIAVCSSRGLSGETTNLGPHRFTAILFAYTSCFANNGQAFASLNANTLLYNVTTAGRDAGGAVCADGSGAGAGGIVCETEEGSGVVRDAGDGFGFVRCAGDGVHPGTDGVELTGGAGARSGAGEIGIWGVGAPGPEKRDPSLAPLGMKGFWTWTKAEVVQNAGMKVSATKRRGKAAAKTARRQVR